MWITTHEFNRLKNHSLSTEAKQAIVVDYDTNQILFEKNSNQLIEPASMTKMLTAYVAFDRIRTTDLSINNKCLISLNAYKMGGSRMFLNNNFRVTPSINFEKLKKINSNEYFFDGYIARLDLRYQFNTELNFRIISEYNEFTDKFFVQPLISWRPNPDTIFYFGGNQNYIDNFVDYNSPNYRVSKTQLFLKVVAGPHFSPSKVQYI